MLLLFVTVVTVVQRPASRKWQNPRVKPENTWVFPGISGVLPALDAGDRRGSLPGLPYCCSAGLTLATVVGEPHCCSVVTVNTSNTVQLPTLNSSSCPIEYLLAEILNVVQVFIPAHAVTVCYCCYCCIHSGQSKQKMAKNPGVKPENRTWYFPGISGITRTGH